MSCECSDDTICKPIKTVKELLDFEKNPFNWCNLVDPITPRSQSRFLGVNYQTIDFDEDVKFVENSKRPQLLLCHDYKGNYLEDKYVVDSPKAQWHDYRFYNWSSVDIFCYFSHNFVTIPTLQWLNCAHRNGVKVIGTIIIEGHNCPLLTEILESDEIMEKVADVLVNISKYLQFEGWLVNIECELSIDKVPLLKKFVKYLTDKSHHMIPGSQIIWYDSVTVKGKLFWQNELNDHNAAYFENCDGIFLNYNWVDGHLDRTEKYVAKKYPTRKLDVYFGIDIFGRGQVGKLDTHATLKRVVDRKFSTSIFAPAWTHESLDTINESLPLEDKNKNFLKLNDQFWSSLWRYLYVMGPTDLPFSTSLCIGSGKQKFILGFPKNNSQWFNLSKQQFQPSIPMSSYTDQFMNHFNNALMGGSCLKIKLNTLPNFRLFVCNFSCKKDLMLAYAFQKYSADVIVNVSLKVIGPQNIKIICGDGSNTPGENINDLYGKQLSKNEMMDVARAYGRELKIPGFSNINNWEIRHYYISFKNYTEARITDIGLEVVGLNAESHILFGGLSLHEGKPQEDLKLNNITEVFINK